MNRVAEDRLLNFRYGLNGLQRDASLVRLPDETAAPAVDTTPAVALDALFEARTAADVMLDATAPPIPRPQLLEPATFALALADARGLVLDATVAASGERQKTLAEALEVVEAALQDRSSLDVARIALMRG